MGSLGISNHREGHHPPLGGSSQDLDTCDTCDTWVFITMVIAVRPPKSWGCVIPPEPFMAEIYGLINGADCKHLHPLGQV